MNWKTWTIGALILVGVFAIYVFGASEAPHEQATPLVATPRNVRTTAANVPGVEQVHLEWLEDQSGSYRSSRNLFAFREPPPPPPPPAPAPPPDKDKDGIPDFQDNCPGVANSDQTDVDRNGIGAACQEGVEPIPPPPPPPKPVPPQFTYRYIGTFGTGSNPIAAFAAEGEIVNARIGDVIGGKFVLRSIGIESVEIGFVGFPADETQRIPLAQ